MITFEVTSQNNRPQQELFDTISVLVDNPLYRMGAQTAVRMTDTPAGTGSRMRTVDRLTTRKVEVMPVIAVLDLPHKYASKNVAGCFPGEITLEFEPKEYSPRVASRGEIEVKNVFKLFESLFSKRIEKQTQGDFDRLKFLLERG